MGQKHGGAPRFIIQPHDAAGNVAQRFRQLSIASLVVEDTIALGLSFEESHRAVKQGLRALETYHRNLRKAGRETLDRLESETAGLKVLEKGRLRGLVTDTVKAASKRGGELGRLLEKK